MDRFRGKSQCGAYGDFMVETDFRVGQILGVLDELGVAKNTMVIYSSDNGPENTWKKRIEVYNHRSSAVYRDGKRSRYEGGHRVPFLIRWPAKIKAGSTCDIAVCQTDFLATFAEMLCTKLPVNSAEDSASFYAVLTGGSIRRPPIIHHSAQGEFALREGRWKLIVNEGRGKKRAARIKYELYDLNADPSETDNLATTQLDRVKAMAETLRRLRAAPGSVR